MPVANGNGFSRPACESMLTFVHVDAYLIHVVITTMPRKLILFRSQLFRELPNAHRPDASWRPSTLLPWQQLSPSY